MLDDYKKWYAQKEDFLNHLFHHDSIIFHRFENVIRVLNFIETLDEKEINEDYEVIFDCGFSYLFSTVSEMELYLDKYFNNNFHRFLEYELLINYSLYVNKLKSVLEEYEVMNKDIQKEFSAVLEEIDDIVINKKKFDNEIVDKFDAQILSTFTYSKEYITTPEVFDRIAEELQVS